MNVQRKLKSIDRIISSLSSTSKIAPPEFLDAELRRMANRFIIRDVRFGYRDSFSIKASLPEMIPKLEQEYLCYFERTKFERKFQPRNDAWKFIYAGCNAQIEFFLRDHGFNKFLSAVGFTKKTYHPVREIANKKMSDTLRRYMTGIGYLYPEEDSSFVHPNLLWGQTRTGNIDSSFLTRDLIRCPYFEAPKLSGENTISDAKLWDYWRDLAALSTSDLPEYRCYHADQFLSGKVRPEISPYLRLGRRLVPQRYVEKEAQAEQFEWDIPPDVKKKLEKWERIVGRD